MISDTGAPAKWRWWVLDQSHLRIQGILFSDYDGGAIQVRTVEADITDIEIVDCTFEHQRKYSEEAVHAVWITSSQSERYLQNITIQDNSFLDVDTGTEPGESNEVLTVYGNVHDVKIVGNSIVDATNIGIDIIGRSILGQPERILVKGNSVARHGSAGMSSAGIYLDGAGTHIIVEGNLVQDGPLGITVNLEPEASDLGTHQVIVRRNALYNNRINLKLGVGGALDGCAGSGLLGDSVAVHNTAVSNIDDAANHYFGCGENLRWKNNIYSHTSLTEGYQYKFANETVDPSTWVIDSNFFHSGGGTKYYRWEGDTYDSLASFQAASGQDQNSREGDPLFVDVSNRDFRLREDSPAWDSGGPLAVTIGSGTGVTVPVDDARYFSDGFGLQAGDRIQVGDSDPVTVSIVDYVRNVVTVDASISWEGGEPVNYEYVDSGPDMGAYEEHPVQMIFLPMITLGHSPLVRPNTCLTGDRMAMPATVLVLLLGLVRFTQFRLPLRIVILATTVGIPLAWRFFRAATTCFGAV